MSGINKIDKLIDVVSRQNELLDTGVHATNAVELKKEWYNYVLLSLEKAQTAIDKLSTDQHEVSKELVVSVAKIKDDLRSEMIDLRSVYDINLEKMEQRLEKTLDGLSIRISAMSPEQLTTEITTLRSELLQYINKTKEDLRVQELDPLKKSVTTLTVKVALIGMIGGLIGTGVIMITSALIKYFGGP